MHMATDCLFCVQLKQPFQVKVNFSVEKCTINNGPTLVPIWCFGEHQASSETWRLGECVLRNP